jgi:hypothetical protein
MQQITESAALFKRMDMCFFQKHGENGFTEPFTEPEGFKSTEDEDETVSKVQEELRRLPGDHKLSSHLEAQSVRQRQQEKQKELATETACATNKRILRSFLGSCQI